MRAAPRYGRCSRMRTRRSVIADRIASVLGDSESAYPVEEIRWAAQRFLASPVTGTAAAGGDRRRSLGRADPRRPDRACRRGGPGGAGARALPGATRVPREPAGLGGRVDRPRGSEPRGKRGAAGAARPGRRRRGARDQIVTTASGNPLFLEQLAAFAAERRSPDGGVLPPTLHSLLAARLDGLGPGERAVVERAAVVGREFWAGAVADLLPPQGRATLPRHLEALARKGLTEADASPAPFEQAFHFRHVLIQEAAYRSLPKGRRAELHERVAGWLEHSPLGLTVDAGQVVGYHLERAYRYRSELGLVDDGLRSLGERAGDRLAAAGRRALEREDAAAAVNLLERALALPADRPAHLALSLRFAEALDIAGEAERQYTLLGQAVEEARSSGDRRTEWLAAVQLAGIGSSVAPAEWSNERVFETATRALEVFEELGDDLGLARAWMLMAEPLLGNCRYDEAADRFRRALLHAERTGDEREVLLVHDYLHRALYFGSAHVSVVRAEAEAMLARAGGRPRATTFALLTLAGVQAMSGEEDESRQLYLRAKAIAEEVGLGFLLAMVPFFSQEVGLLFGDAEFAERETRAGYERLEAAGDKASARPWRPCSRRRCSSSTVARKQSSLPASRSPWGPPTTLRRRRRRGPCTRKSSPRSETSMVPNGLGVRRSSTRRTPMTSTCAPSFCSPSPRFFASPAATTRRRLRSRMPPTRATARAMSSGRRTLARVSPSSTRARDRHRPTRYEGGPSTLPRWNSPNAARAGSGLRLPSPIRNRSAGPFGNGEAKMLAGRSTTPASSRSPRQNSSTPSSPR